MPAYSNPDLTASAADLVPVAFDTLLDPVPLGLRISNPTAGWATVAVLTLGGGATVRTIDVPPGVTIAEMLRVTQVNTVGTTVGLGISAYRSL